MTANTQVNYKVLAYSKLNFLEDAVAEWTHDGYRLVGGIAVYLDKSGSAVFMQAVAKYP